MHKYIGICWGVSSQFSSCTRPSANQIPPRYADHVAGFEFGEKVRSVPIKPSVPVRNKPQFGQNTGGRVLPTIKLEAKTPEGIAKNRILDHLKIL